MLSLTVLLLMTLNPVLTNNLTQEIDVLVFLPKNNSFLFSQARVAPAIRYAQHALTAQFPNFHFSLQLQDSDSVNQAVFALADRSCERKPDLILGPVREYEAAAVVRLASHWNIPVVSAGALAVAFRNKDSEYSHLTRIAPSYMKMAEVFSAMFERFSWRSALLLIEDDMKERDCYFTLEAVYHVMDDYTVKSLTFSEEEPLRSDEILQNIRDTEVVIMCAGADRIREIMLAAHKQQLTNGSYIFFNVDLFNASSYGNGSWKRGDEHDDDARQAYASLNTVTLLRTVKPEYRNFSIEIKKSTDRLGLRDCSDCGNVNMFVEGFHDAMLLYAVALHEAMKNGYSKKNGTEITSHMWNITFEGIAGQVSMDINGDRNGDFSLMAMTNVEAGSYEVVANYFGVNKTFQLMSAFDSKRFMIKGRHEANPELPQKSCELGVSALTGVTVGALLGAVMLIAFYFFRKNYRIIIQRRTHGEEPYCGKHHQLQEDSIKSNSSAA
ncbi:atrial natriuretic peptide receptor 3 [Kryptolebias marmoratus]|uniref:Natriuretic peptide receptor 3 n=1 Tax=Kryptolebias marmoratus TaxID=37003 RepID=A0A3Q3B593_KRYMA|nr:atrial natriuretic peptide receptor 3 [Kryptolebias marmoratus]